MLPIKTAGATTETGTGTASTVFGAFLGRYAKLHSARGVIKNGLHAALRLVERRSDSVRDGDRAAAVRRQFAGRNAAKSEYAQGYWRNCRQTRSSLLA